MVLVLPEAAEPPLPVRVLISPSTARRRVVMVTVETARQEKSKRIRDKQSIPFNILDVIVLSKFSSQKSHKQLQMSARSSKKNLHYEKFYLQSDELIPWVGFQQIHVVRAVFHECVWRVTPSSECKHFRLNTNPSHKQRL